MRKANEFKGALCTEHYVIEPLTQSIKEDMRELNKETKKYLKEKFSL